MSLSDQVGSAGSATPPLAAEPIDLIAAEPIDLIYFQCISTWLLNPIPLGRTSLTVGSNWLFSLWIEEKEGRWDVLCRCHGLLSNPFNGGTLLYGAVHQVESTWFWFLNQNRTEQLTVCVIMVQYSIPIEIVRPNMNSYSPS
jgi:hypothetical protein